MVQRNAVIAAIGILVLAGCQGGATIGSGGGAGPVPVGSTGGTSPAPGTSPTAIAKGATPAPTATATTSGGTVAPTPTPSPTSSGSTAVSTAKMVTVGTTGNEPLLQEAPDGTLYISALANVYRSLDNGVTWTLQPAPTIAATVVASDSAISVSPNGTLYYTFDYPYAGNTAVCTSTDRAETWTCDPAVAPGGTDRMWVTAPGNDEAYETTNEGLYQTAFLESSNGGSTWNLSQLADEELQPGDGPIMKLLGTNTIVQVVDNDPGRYVYRYTAGAAGTVPTLTSAVNTGVASGEALPSDAQDTSGNFYLVGDATNAAGGDGVQIGRSTDQGKTYTILPMIPQTQTGTVTFTSIAAGKPGHVAVLYYYTTANVSDVTAANTPWSAEVAETYDAFDAIPVWTVTTLEPVVHTGGMCANAGCTGDTRYSGDFIYAIIDQNEHLNMTWMDEPNAALTPTVRFERLH